MQKKIAMKEYLRWFLISLLIAPASIFLHELGHLLAAYLLDYSNSVLHFASVSRGDFPGPLELDSNRWVISSAGPIFTFILTIVSCLLVKRNWHKSIFIALGLAAPIRNLGSVVGLLKLLSGADPRRNDEVKVAVFSHIPSYIPLLFSALILIGAWIYLIQQLKANARWTTLLVIIAGGALGNITWLLVIGPMILP